MPRTVRRGSTSFFFQAEDGIRNVAVTGVQSCSLPICVFLVLFVCCLCVVCVLFMCCLCVVCVLFVCSFLGSEERRVGKECRFWWAT